MHNRSRPDQDPLRFALEGGSLEVEESARSRAAVGTRVAAIPSGVSDIHHAVPARIIQGVQNLQLSDMSQVR